MRVADLVVRCLENEGVRHVFGLPGEETLALGLALEDSEQIQSIVVRHEQGAAFMADVYGRPSSYPGVCIATLGPGATNLLTGVADANLDRAPLVAITGQAGLERIHKESHQYVDVLRMFAPVVKWNARIELPETAPEIVRKAFRLARLEKPGATHIELPEDVAEREVVAVPLAVRRTRYAQAGEDALARAAELINGAAQPIVLVGNGVILREASGHGAVRRRRSPSARRTGRVANRRASRGERLLREVLPALDDHGRSSAGRAPWRSIEASQADRRNSIEGVDVMCMNCGCGKNEERHKPTDITLSDLTAAAKGHDMEVEKAADNIHDGARALKKSGQIS